MYVSVRGIIIDGEEVYAIFRRRLNDDGNFKEYYDIMVLEKVGDLL